MSSHDPIAEELLKLNKDEEFEYFKSQKLVNTGGKFQKWNVDEHKRFLMATGRLDFMKPNEMLEIQSSINEGGQLPRSLEEIQMHINVYKNYCNKQRNAQPFLKNLMNNTFQTIMDSLDHSDVGKMFGVEGGSSPPLPHLQIASTPLPPHLQGLVPNQMTKRSAAESINPALYHTNPPHSMPMSNIPQSSSSPSSPMEPHSPPPPSSAPKKTPAAKPVKPRGKAKAAARDQNPPLIEVEYSNDDVQSAADKKNQKILSEPWTGENQRQLEEALVKYPESRFSSVSRWQAISKDIGISPKAVALRYNQMLINLTPSKGAGQVSNNDSIPDEDVGGKKRKQPGGSAPKKTPAKKKEKLESDVNNTYITNHQQSIPPPTQSPSKPPTPLSIELQNSLSKAEDLSQRNTVLLEEIKKNIMLNLTNTPESVNILKEFIENSNTALKASACWSASTTEMPPIPFRVNDMIIGILSNQQPNQSQSQSAQSPSGEPVKFASLKKPLPKEIIEWNLSYN